MFVRFIKRLMHDGRGGTAIEYGLIAALLVVVMIAAFEQLANTTTGMWDGVSAKVQGASAERATRP
jgi:pilus assembly protein Flp/PilA